jgi:hypothetical protein
MPGWLAGLLACWLCGWLAGLLAGWLAGWLARWLACWLAGLLAGRLLAGLSWLADVGVAGSRDKSDPLWRVNGSGGGMPASVGYMG